MKNKGGKCRIVLFSPVSAVRTEVFRVYLLSAFLVCAYKGSLVLQMPK